MSRCALTLLAPLLLFAASPAMAIVAPSSTPADFTGNWAGTNWSMSTVGVMQWGIHDSPGDFASAVAISPYTVLTARHLGTQIGDVMTIGGVTLNVLNVQTPPFNGYGTPDLNLVTVDKPLPVAEWETLYNGNYAAQPNAILIGYGFSGQTSRYNYTVNYSSPLIKRWGTNSIYMPLGFGDGSTTYTQGFVMLFDSHETAYEAGYATFDSGGGTFVKVGNKWKLAGIDLEVISEDGGATFTNSYAGDVSYYYDWIIDNTTIKGDANMDLKVNFADYLALEAGFGKTGASWDSGDFDHDGDVDFADYLLLEANFGKTAFPVVPGGVPWGDPIAENGQVPEPATIGLLLAGCMALLRRRR